MKKLLISIFLLFSCTVFSQISTDNKAELQMDSINLIFNKQIDQLTQDLADSLAVIDNHNKLKITYKDSMCRVYEKKLEGKISRKEKERLTKEFMKEKGVLNMLVFMDNVSKDKRRQAFNIKIDSLIHLREIEIEKLKTSKLKY